MVAYATRVFHESRVGESAFLVFFPDPNSRCCGGRTVSCSSPVEIFPTVPVPVLSHSLRDMAETNLLRGEPLPLPDARRTDTDADLEEPIYLLLQAGQQLTLIAKLIALPHTYAVRGQE